MILLLPVYYYYWLLLFYCYNNCYYHCYYYHYYYHFIAIDVMVFIIIIIIDYYYLHLVSLLTIAPQWILSFTFQNRFLLKYKDTDTLFILKTPLLFCTDLCISGPRPWPPICIYRQLVFTNPDRNFAFTGPSP